ncbi:MAG: M20 family metallopeptidase [Candidatus Bipolaricaulota bacterium]
MDWKREAGREVDRLDARLRQVSQYLFAHPELKFEEQLAAERLAGELEADGFSVERGAAGLATALRAEHPAVSTGPAVVVIAEYDALPDLGHACGHNLIASAALGAALAVGTIKRELPGRLLFFGTPAEEGGGGKVLMIDAGLFRDIDAAMMFHPAPFTVVGHGSLAITEVRIEFRGVAAHASAWPEKGVNALDAVIQTYNGINALRQHLRDGSRIHGVITHGGVKPNIVPDYAAAEFYVRSADSAYRDQLVDKLRRCAEGAALATGATLTFAPISVPYKAMKRNRTLEEAFARNLGLLKWPVDVPPAGMTLPMGSTDMGDVSHVVPSLHPYFSICGPEVAGHSREFGVASSSERGHRAMMAAAKAMALTAVDLLTSPDLVRDAWSEFRA